MLQTHQYGPSQCQRIERYRQQFPHWSNIARHRMCAKEEVDAVEDSEDANTTLEEAVEIVEHMPWCHQVAFFPDSGSLLTRKDTFPKTTHFETVAATCSSPQTHLQIHGWFSHTFVVRRCEKTNRHPPTIISHLPRRLQPCRFCGHQ